MKISAQCDRQDIELAVPDDATVYASSFPPPLPCPADRIVEAVRRPIGSASLRDLLARRRPGNVVVVASDITRPIPYAQFLPQLLAELESAGVPREQILILIATGMHRPGTADERRQMFGPEVVRDYRIADHSADTDCDLVEIPGTSRAGARVRLNWHFVEAGFRLLTGLVEPHLMAGFSGGRKAVCPGLCALETVRMFHGYRFLADPRATNGVLAGNPCHEEALSIARLAGVDFSLNVTLNERREIVAVFAGDLEAAHEHACRFVDAHACPAVRQEADVVVTSAGGYPLDATFYQCVKGMISCLPAVRKGGVILLFGGCREGIGSPEYEELMRNHAGRWRAFLKEIEQTETVVRDQWQFQVQARALERVGQENLYFVTDGLPQEQLDALSVHGVAASPGGVEAKVQDLIDRFADDGRSLAVIPEGPYCTPMTPS